MATLSRNIQTNDGAKLWTTAISGENKIIYSKAELYPKKISNLSDSQVASLTKVDTPLLSCNLAVTDIDNTTVRVSAEFTNETLQNDISFNSIGWFATTAVDQAQGKDPILFAVSEIDTESNLIASTQNSSTSFFLAQLVMGVSNTNQVQLIAGTTGFVKYTDLEQRIIELSNQGLIDLGKKLTQDSSVLDIHNTSLHYVPYGTVKGLPVTQDDNNLGGFLISLGNGAVTQDGVQIYFEPLSHKTFISYFLTKNNIWSQWIEVGIQSYTKEEIDKMIGPLATRDYANSIKSDLMGYVLNGLAFTDFKGNPKAPYYSGIKLDLDNIQYKTLGIIRFSDCSIILGDSYNHIMSTINGMNSHADLITSLSQDKIYSGWILNLKLNDKYLYQYVIVIDDRAATRLFKREVPIGDRTSDDRYRYDLKEIEVYPDAIVDKTKLNAKRMESLYNGGLISNETINLDTEPDDFENQVGIQRFTRCRLTTNAVNRQIINQGILYSNDTLDGWITWLPTGSETNNNNNKNYYLQVVVCYPSASANPISGLGYEVETYYRIKQSSAYSNINFFHRIETSRSTNKFESGRLKYDFNNMIDDVEGFTSINSVFGKSLENNTYYTASDIGLPSFLDIIINNRSKYFGELSQRGLFKYKVRAIKKDISEDPETIQIFQKIKVFGFVFVRSGYRSYPSAPVWNTEWRLAENYSPFNDLYASRSDYAQIQKNSVFLPEKTDLNKVGTTIYNELNYTYGFLPQGIYNVDGKYVNGPTTTTSSMNGFLITFSSASYAIQIYLPAIGTEGIFYRGTISSFSSGNTGWKLLKGTAV